MSWSERPGKTETLWTRVGFVVNAHMLWDSIQPNLQDVKRGHVKARFLTGTYITYMLQSTKFKSNSADVDPKCLLCRLESEDLQHLILRCPAQSIYLPIRLNPRRGHLRGSGEPSAGC